MITPKKLFPPPSQPTQILSDVSSSPPPNRFFLSMGGFYAPTGGGCVWNCSQTMGGVFIPPPGP